MKAVLKKALLIIIAVVVSRCSDQTPKQGSDETSIGSNQENTISQNPDSIIDQINRLHKKYIAEKKTIIKEKGFVPGDTLIKFSRTLKSLRLSIESFYGTNDIKDVPDILTLTEKFRASAKCVCAVIRKKHLKRQNGGFIIESGILKERDFGANTSLCGNENFLDEINPSTGTGWAYRSNLIVTAGHVIPNMDSADKFLLVFGLTETKSGLFVPDNRVYKIVEVLKKRQEDKLLDFSILRVDKAVPVEWIGKLSDPSSIAINEKVYMMGHPIGLPLKFTPNGKVFRIENGELITNLDSYEGNSGSPVFDSIRLTIEGILIRGNHDFNYSSDGKCIKSISYNIDHPATKFTGERVLLLSNILKKYQ